MSLRRVIFTLMFCSSGMLLAEKNTELPLPPFAGEVKDKGLFGNLSEDEKEALKASIKAEVLQELKTPDQAWKQDIKPQLNFLELDGYFRVRADAFHRCDLGTYIPATPANGNAPPIPGTGIGTSGCPPPLSYFNEPADASAAQRAAWLLSSNMRLRVDPTLNVTEDIRIKSTVDVFDNLVLGSTPNYMTGLSYGNPNMPNSFLAGTQNTPLIGINNPYGSINVKRLWGEVTTPAGELRFGRMPLHFGLGLMYNASTLDLNDYGDNIDGVMLATRVLGHYLIPGVSVSYTGASGKERGYSYIRESGKLYLNAEAGQRIDLDPVDNVYSFFLIFAKKDKLIDAKVLLNEGKVVWNYGALGSYRFQLKDSMYSMLNPDGHNINDIKKEMVDRNAHIGVLSLWGDFRWSKLQIEAEAVGILGHVGQSKGLWGASDANKNVPLWITQAGVAMRSKYTLLNDRLELGLDAGWASGGQVGERNTYFRFHPDYRVDFLLFNQILGTISNAVYVRPHVGYFFTENFSIRGDVISSFAPSAAATSGKNNLLGLELDGSLIYQADEGLHFMLQYGLLIPFAGLNHDKAVVTGPQFDKFGSATTASAIRLFAGINF